MKETQKEAIKRLVARIDNLRTTNTALLEVVRDCVNFLADLNTTAPTDRAKALHKRAYTAHSKAKETQ